MASQLTYSCEKRRVVITGMGVITACGHTLDTFWENVRLGKSAASRVSRFDTSHLPNQIAAEIKDFDPGQYLDAKQARRFETSTQYGMSAAILAAQDAGIDFSQLDADRAGIVEATSVGGMESTLKAHSAYMKKGWRSISPFIFINAYCGSGSGEVALKLGIKGHAITYCSGSASGNDAVGYAMKMIQTDEADVMVAGGAEAPIVEGFWDGFCVAKVMTRELQNPAQGMKPFDARRDGFLMGEGAGFLVMEELSHALGRGAKIYAEVLAQERSCEAYHSVAPHPDGLGMCRAMEKALRVGRLHPSEVDYINAHGTATEANDASETKAIKRLFGTEARRLAVSSTKPVTGHMLGAAGAIETIICALAIEKSTIPPTINLKEPAPECDLDYVAEGPRHYPINVALNLNCGFGGKNSCLVLKRYSDG